MYNIQSTYFILALFVRDDGERFLLGDGMFEFADKQLHFAPNSVQSDIVELQGSDGQLLAGQVMRSSKQTFEGIIGDQTSTRTEIENARRRFINFFKTNKKYQVIYVLPDGRSITRYKGFLVDAPSAQELYQLTPKYSVSLMFEELPYYAYAEDDEGNPDFTDKFLLVRSTQTQVLDGGLVWDARGAVWDGAPQPKKNRFNLQSGDIYRERTVSGLVYASATTNMHDGIIDINGHIYQSGRFYFLRTNPTEYWTLCEFASGEAPRIIFSVSVEADWEAVSTIYLRIRVQNTNGLHPGIGKTITLTQASPSYSENIGPSSASYPSIAAVYVEGTNSSSGTTTCVIEPASGYSGDFNIQMKVQIEIAQSADDQPTPWTPGGMTPAETLGAIWEEATLVEGESHINKFDLYTFEGEPVVPNLRLSAGTYGNIIVKNLTNGTSIRIPATFASGRTLDYQGAWYGFQLEQGINEIVMTADTFDGSAQLVWNSGVVG